MPPDTVTKLYMDSSLSNEYRKSPFIIQAASADAGECFMNLAKRGANIHDTGYIGLSKKRKNQVMSNVIGAAAYNGSVEILKALLVK